MTASELMKKIAACLSDDYDYGITAHALYGLISALEKRGYIDEKDADDLIDAVHYMTLH